MTLQSLTKFTLEQKLRKDIDLAQRFINCSEYATFLQQPLTLGMFTPCNKEGLPYKTHLAFSHSADIGNFICEPYEGLFEIQANEKSKGWAYLDPERTRYYDKVAYAKAKEDFEQSKECVLFEGFEYKIGKLNGETAIWINTFGGLRISEIEKMTIEDLVICDLELTETAIKKLNF